MSFDDLQSKWQSHDHGTPLKVDADLLLKEVQRNHQDLAATLLRRDMVEVVAAIFVAVVFGIMAVQMKEWTLWLCSFGGLFVGSCFVVSRWIQARKHPRPGSDASLQSCIQASLVQVDHQIWLLKNIFWWYLLPLFLGVVAFLMSLAWRFRASGLSALGLVAIVGLTCAATAWAVYWLNQQVVKKSLLPRRAELESLLESLKPPTSVESHAG